MKINDREIKAVIFDLDGTLLDSSSVWIDVDRDFFAMHNMEVPSDYNQKIAHLGLKDCAILTKNEYGIKDSVEEILDTWINMVKSKYANEVKMKPNGLEYIKYLKSKGIKLGVATANNKNLYGACLINLGIIDFFDVIADVDKVNTGKHSSKIYDYVADKLNLSHEEIAVIEDMPICLKTAYEANYYTIAIYDSHASDEETKHKYSYKYIYDFKELMEE